MYLRCITSQFVWMYWRTFTNPRKAMYSMYDMLMRWAWRADLKTKSANDNVSRSSWTLSKYYCVLRLMFCGNLCAYKTTSINLKAFALVSRDALLNVPSPHFYLGVYVVHAHHLFSLDVALASRLLLNSCFKGFYSWKLNHDSFVSLSDEACILQNRFVKTSYTGGLIHQSEGGWQAFWRSTKWDTTGQYQKARTLKHFMGSPRL